MFHVFTHSYSITIQFLRMGCFDHLQALSKQKSHGYLYISLYIYLCVRNDEVLSNFSIEYVQMLRPSPERQGSPILYQNLRLCWLRAFWLKDLYYDMFLRRICTICVVCCEYVGGRVPICVLYLNERWHVGWRWNWMVRMWAWLNHSSIRVYYMWLKKCKTKILSSEMIILRLPQTHLGGL